GYHTFSIVRARRGLDASLWRLRPPALIVSHSIYGPYVPFGSFPAYGGSFSASFVLPPETKKVIGAYPEDFAAACRRFPKAVAIRTNRDRHEDKTRAYPFSKTIVEAAVAEYPPWSADLPLPIKHWRLIALPCSAIIDSPPSK
ncbi:MAG: hypothetical protein AAF449_09710, partial [Myxococcota bacterium]